MNTTTKVVLFVFLTALLVLAASGQSNDTNRYWVYLRDKAVPAGQERFALEKTRQDLTARALHRRMKSMPQLVDAYDLAVSPDYIAQIQSTGATIRRLSKWLNAVSVEANPSQVESLKSLRCVAGVERFRLRSVNREPVGSRTLDDPAYGPSFKQYEMTRIPELHARGLSGRGVLICFLDSGFRITHQVFDSLHVLHAYDFIFGDTIVANQIEQDSVNQDNHGSACLSAAAGYRDSLLIGPAYGADYLLAKTEWVPTETQPEEDNYVAALEWADSLGADITSSSLGYLDWYTFENMDGQTAVTTRAVNIAVSHGILVVTAAGNERQSEWAHIISPADADSILAVGAVDTTGLIATFSSPGPTADGRIKPDICAVGVEVFSANVSTGDDTYFRISGTSLSTPIMSGLAALIMEAHPDWTAQQVRTALMQTACHAQAPDNDYGWGIADGVAAADYVFNPATDSQKPMPTSSLLMSTYPNPVNGIVSIQLQIPGNSGGELKIFDVTGRQVMSVQNPDGNRISFHYALDVSTFSSGVYFARFEGNAGRISRKFIVLK